MTRVRPSDVELADAAATIVAEAMICCPKLLPATAAVDAVRESLRSEHVHAALLVDGGALVAVVEASDLSDSLPADSPAVALGSLRGRVTRPDADLVTTRDAMTALGRRRLAVVDSGGRCLGLLCLKNSGRGFCSDADVRARALDL